MKRTLMTVLIFAVILAALVGVAELVERLSPAEETPVVEETPAPETVITNEMTPDKATVIQLNGDSVSFLGVGAEARGGVVTIAYPGTYRVTGTLTDGQLVVDLGDYHGGVYIILDGADITCADGPAIHVVQADLTVLHLAEGTKNSVMDGADYFVQEGTMKKSGAAVYSADDLRIEGDGALMVRGASADGIRSKDTLTVSGGSLRVFSKDDGLQGSDAVEITGGTVMVWSSGDGVTTTEGDITITGGTVSLVTGGDGVDACAGLEISGGVLSVTANGGAENYAQTALADISAKGLKGENITISRGVIELNTADDGIHGAREVTITGGSIAIASGDDAIHAADTLAVTGGSIDVTESYEALEGDTVRLENVTVTAAAQNNGVDAGEGGFTARSASLALAAPRGVSSDGTLSMLGGGLMLEADGTDSLFAFKSTELSGAEILAYAETGRSAALLAKGRLPGSLLYVFNDPIPAGQEYVLTDPSGAVVMSFTLEKDAGAVLIASGALTEQTYTLTTGENVIRLDYTADDCAVYEEELPVQQMGGFGGFPGGGPRR